MQHLDNHEPKLVREDINILWIKIYNEDKYLYEIFCKLSEKKKNYNCSNSLSFPFQKHKIQKPLSISFLFLSSNERNFC